MADTHPQELAAQFRANRENYLIGNMKRWRRVAEIEHANHCKARHDCSAAIERIYNKLMEADNG